MSEDRLAFAERAVPRYTSYPTAPHFHPGVDADTYARWLEALPAETGLSLYLHVPFCTALCTYCGCHTQAVNHPEPVMAYLEGLLAEVELVASHTQARRVTRIHWGGGTPTMLGLPGMEQVIAHIAARFDLSHVTEHAIELDPRGLDQALARGLARLGITRASLGAQDFNAEVQRAIGRIQPFEVVMAGVGHLREAGIDAINLDLMYGLPHQGCDELERSLLMAHSLSPDRIALFGYAHVPWMRKQQKLIQESWLPGAQARLEQAEAARRLLAGLGYTAIGLDHFTRPDDALAIAAREGRLMRNFQGYTDDTADALLGLGASSIGKLPQGFVQNQPDIRTYRNTIKQGRFATIRGLELTDDDRRRGAVIERLMCDFMVEVPADLLPDAMPTLVPLMEAGMVLVRGRWVTMTSRGRPFVRVVAAAFDAWLAKAGRHSAAV